MSHGIRINEKQRARWAFTAVPNEMAQDAEIPAQCLGMLVYLLSKPPGWKGRAYDIEKRFKIGTKLRRKAIMKAEEHGWLKYVREHVDGRLDCYYEVQVERLPVDQRTDSSKATEVASEIKAEDEIQPPPAEGVVPEGVLLEGVLPEGGIDKKELSKKELSKKEGEASPLRTEEELQAKTGLQPTNQDKLDAQEILFMSTGKTHDINQMPKYIAWVMNVRRTQGDVGMRKLLKAYKEPEKYEISRSWAHWDIEKKLFGDTAPKLNKEEAILREAKRRWANAKAIGQTAKDFIDYGSDISKEIKRKAVEESGDTV